MSDIKNNSNNNAFLMILRWTARIVGTVFVLFCLLFIIGDIMEGINKNSGSASSPWSFLMIMTMFFFSLALAGLIVALWREVIGGLISFAGMVLTIILVRLNHDANYSNMLFIFLLPSLLYLFYWWLDRKSEKGKK